VLYKSGEQWWLNADETTIAEKVQEQRVAVHPWQDIMTSRGWLDEQDTWSSVELLAKLGLQVKDQNPGHKLVVASIMKKLGWHNKPVRMAGNLARRWSLE
jgi:hypothetical protein